MTLRRRSHPVGCLRWTSQLSVVVSLSVFFSFMSRFVNTVCQFNIRLFKKKVYVDGVVRFFKTPSVVKGIIVSRSNVTCTFPYTLMSFSEGDCNVNIDLHCDPIHRILRLLSYTTDFLVSLSRQRTFRILWLRVGHRGRLVVTLTGVLRRRESNEWTFYYCSLLY